MIFFDEPPQYSGLYPDGGQTKPGAITYEETVDAAQLYNPVSGTVKSGAFTGTRIYPSNPSQAAPIQAPPTSLQVKPATSLVSAKPPAGRV